MFCVLLVGHKYDDPASRTAINPRNPGKRRLLRLQDGIVVASRLISKTPNQFCVFTGFGVHRLVLVSIDAS